MKVYICSFFEGYSYALHPALEGGVTVSIMQRMLYYTYCGESYSVNSVEGVTVTKVGKRIHIVEIVIVSIVWRVYSFYNV